jgi:ATP-binding cassette subfamily B protein
MLVGGYLRDMGMHMRNMQKALNEIEDIIQFTDMGTEIEDRADAKTFRPGTGHIAFSSVDFGYANQSAKVYRDFNIAIKPGERVALVGKSGSGKSTFVKLVQRLHDVNGGRILVDNQDVREVTQESLRRSIALVPQEPILFHRSLAENIAYARPGATQGEIEAAARRAHAHDFISRLPQGYETLVGERGVKLSGGERQRVAIARAFLADAPILILDEATSSLDSITETHIQAAIEDLMVGRTTILIAHRLSTIQSVDRILVFANGQVVEQGSHGELMGRPGGHYQALYATQYGVEAISA